MNKIFRSPYTILCLCTVLLLQGCGNDDESATERTSRLLRSATWTLNKLTVDGTDQTSLFQDMVLSITAGAYTVQNGEPVWPTSGTWKLTDATTIDRDNGTMVKIEHLDATTLTISLHWSKTTYTGGRERSVSGDHVFELVKR